MLRKKDYLFCNIKLIAAKAAHGGGAIAVFINDVHLQTFNKLQNFYVRGMRAFSEPYSMLISECKKTTPEQRIE